MNRQKRILSWLLGLLLLSGVYAWWSSPVQQHAEPRSGSPAGLSNKQSPGAASVPDDATLHLELLARAEEAYGRTERDIFSFKVLAPPPPPPPPKIEQPVPPPPPPPVEVVQPVAIGPAAARFDFLGSLQKEGRQLVFLASGQDIYLVAEGQRFGKQDEFLLAGIEDNRIRIEQRGISQQIMVQTAEPDVRVDGTSGPGLALPPESATETPPHPLGSFNRSLPRMRNFKRNPGNP